MIKLFAILVVLSISKMAIAVDVNALNPIEKMTVTYQHFDSAMDFNVTLPASYYQAKDKRYFVIFDLHPRSQPYLSGMHDWLSHNGEWPWLESIIVTPASYHVDFAELFEATVADPGDNKLLNFLANNVLKTVDTTYRTNGFRIYSGFMSNGAIGLYALLNKPEMFNAYMIASPSLSDNFLAISSDARNKLPLLTDKSRFLYLTIGQHNYERAHVEAVNLLSKTLDSVAPKTLDWTVHNAEQHYYMSRPVITVLNGIEMLFDDYHNELAPDTVIAKQGVDAIIEYYARLSEQKYGFAVSAEGSLKSLAKSMLANEPKQAIKIYQKVIKLYPDSAYAYSALAAAYQHTGEINKALKYQTIAVEKSLNMIEWHQKNLKNLLIQYQEQDQQVGTD